MRKIVFFWAVAGLLLLFNFNNCASDSSGGLYEEDWELGCTDPTSCDELDETDLELQVNGSDPLNAQGMAVFVVTGACNEAAFPRNRIVWLLRNSSGQVVKAPPSAGTEGVCNRGAWQVSINMAGLPAGVFPASVKYKLELELKAYDDEGREYTNPSLAVKTMNVDY